MSEPLTKEQFFTKIIIQENGCWNWNMCIHHSGYGITRRNRKNKFAHRVAWIFIHGPIPENLYVLHRCDNPRCINPDHLFLGTHEDNMKDMKNKNRAYIPSKEEILKRRKFQYLTLH